MEKLNRIAVSAGEEIIRENNLSRKLFILKKGKVRVYKNYNGAKVTLAVLGPGEIFGELSFFDSKPRSASVEAITDIVFVCIDGQKLSSDIESLPHWVHLVFESVANRFRDIDQKMTALQSLQSFQRKNMSRDTVGITIFSDLLRMTKILRMLIHENGNFQKKKDIQLELESTMGSSFVTPKGYLNVLYDNGFISYSDYENKKVYVFYEDQLEPFEEFLKQCNEHGHYIILNNTCLNLLRKTITFIDDVDLESSILKLPEEALIIDKTNEDQVNALNQLKKIKMIQIQSEGIFVEPKKLIKSFKYYSIVKYFDHTSVFVD